MFRVTRSQLLPIGVDIGRDSLKLLQLEIVEADTPVARAAAQVALGADLRCEPARRIVAAADAVRRLLVRGPFAGRRAAISIPRELVHIKNVRLPVMPPAEVENAVRLEAPGLFSFDAGQAQVRAIPAGEVRQGTDSLQEVIVVAVLNETTDLLLEQFSRAGLDIDSLDAEPCALFRSVERFVRRREDEHEVHVLVDVGVGGTQVVIGRGREISFLKTVDIGGHHFNEAVARRLEIPQDEAQALRRRFAEEPGPGDGRDPVRQAVADATRSDIERLAREVSLCLRYQSVTFRGCRPSRVRLLGGEAGDSQIRQIFASLLSIPVEVARPLSSVDSSQLPAQLRGGSTGEWGVAMGMALRRARGPFGARDGRRRGPLLKDVEPAPAAADAAAPPATEVQHA